MIKKSDAATMVAASEVLRMEPNAGSLAAALAYENGDIVDRFLGHYDIDPQVAESFFQETKKWVWLCGKAHEDRKSGLIDFRLIIDEYMIFIDEMWHNFILFTRDYEFFCRTHAGAFVHHNPTPPKKRHVQHIAVTASDEAHELLLDARKKQYEYIYDSLGADTLRLWYQDYGLKYNKAWFAQRRRDS